MQPLRPQSGEATRTGAAAAPSSALLPAAVPPARVRGPARGVRERRADPGFREPRRAGLEIYGLCTLSGSRGQRTSRMGPCEPRPRTGAAGTGPCMVPTSLLPVSLRPRTSPEGAAENESLAGGGLEPTTPAPRGLSGGLVYTGGLESRPGRGWDCKPSVRLSDALCEQLTGPFGRFLLGSRRGLDSVLGPSTGGRLKGASKSQTG